MSREMKDSGVEWIGEIPKDWKIGRVKNVFIRKNEKARQENPTILSLARSWSSVLVKRARIEPFSRTIDLVGRLFSFSTFCTSVNAVVSACCPRVPEICTAGSSP